MSKTVIEIVLAYLIGSIPSAVWVGKIFYGKTAERSARKYFKRAACRAAGPHSMLPGPGAAQGTRKRLAPEFLSPHRKEIPWQSE